ncbi:hypothetical protein D3C73_1496910 [compost metagenome]
MDHGLRMNHDVDPIQGNVEQQVCLNHFEALVDQAGRVCGDHEAHVPGGVSQRLLRRDVVELFP